MSPLRFALIGVLSLSLSPAASFAGESAGQGESGSDQKSKVFIFPIAVAIPGRDVRSEVLCKGEIEEGDDITYSKCVYKSFEDFEWVGAQYLRLIGKDAVPSLDKGRLKRLRELAMLHLTHTTLLQYQGSRRQRPLSELGREGEVRITKQLIGAIDRVQFDLGKAVARCEMKDAAFMSCKPQPAPKKKTDD